MGRSLLAGTLIAMGAAAACAVLQPPGEGEAPAEPARREARPPEPASQPAADRPSAGDVQPSATQPAATQPAATQPATTQPIATPPVTARPADTPEPPRSRGAGVRDPPRRIAARERLEPAEGEGQPSSGDPKVDEILDRLEIKGEAIKGLGCKLTYKYVTVEPVEDAQIKEGRLLFARAEPNARFLVHFTKLMADGIVSERGEYFLFDGEWLIERNDKARTIIRRQIVRRGERIDPFKLGRGPFPLPFGQKRADILGNFKVTLRPFELGDPRNTWHLRCVPTTGSELAAKYTRVDIYVDRTLELPVRVVTERVSDGNRIEVDFQEIDAAEAPALSRFQIRRPGEKLDDFTVTEEPLPPLDEEPRPSGRAVPGG